MVVSREEALLLLLYTAPTRYGDKPAIFGATRLQKLVFLSTREYGPLSALCPDPYEFVPYDFGPYSNRLERDVDALARSGLVMTPVSSPTPTETNELSFQFLTSHLRRPAGDTYVVLNQKGKQVVDNVLRRLREEGFDPDLVLEDFKHLHGRFTGQNVDDLLRYVYSKYIPFAAKTKRPDLRPPEDDPEADDDEDGEE